MRLFFTIFVAFFLIGALTSSKPYRIANTYYVSNNGDDNNAGTQAQPFKTWAKAFSVAVANDSVLGNRGDTWTEQLKPLANHIYIGAYGTGAKPLITGLQNVTVTSAGSNLWTATVNTPVNGLNNVLINGVQRAKGRYPNSGYITQTGSTSTQLKNTGLTGTPDFTGGEAVTRLVHWVLNKRIISSQSGGTLNLATALEGAPIDNYGFFIQNLPSLNDTEGEWSFNTTSKGFNFYSTAPTPTAQVSFLDTLLWISKKDYITVENLEFRGANTAAIQIDTSAHVIINNCKKNYSGNNGITAFRSPYLTIQNDSIQNSLNDGMYLVGGTHATVIDNYIKNTGTIAGMGQSGEGKYCAIYIGGGDIGANDTLSTVKYNRIDSTGYQPVMFFSYAGSVESNYITVYAFVKDDGGGIYAGWDGGVSIKKNIISGGRGAPVGATGNVIAPGIYFDAGQTNCIADSNTVFDCVWAAMFLNSNAGNTARNNTLIASAGYPLYSGTSSSFFTSKRNILYSQNSSYQVFNQPSTTSTNSIDSNYYLRPTAEANKLIIGGVGYSFATWKTATNYDGNSKETPAGITADLPLFYFNPTKTDSTITFSGDYYDAKGNPFTDKVTLKPFTSILLFKSTNTFLHITGSHIGLQYSTLKSL